MKKKTTLLATLVFSFLFVLTFISILLAQSGISGSPEKIGRQSEAVTFALNTAESTTPAINFMGAAGGQIFIPTGSTITSLTYYTGYDTGVTFLPLYTDDATTPAAVTRTVAAGRAYDLPAACFGSMYVKIVTNAAGSVMVISKG